LEKLSPGGQAILTEIIENYPGFPNGISGPELMQNMEKQAVKFGVQIKYGQVIEVKNDEKSKIKIVKTEDQEYRTLSIIIASGAEARKLNIPGEEKFTGRGVSYCGTCDAPFFKDKKIVLVGGGDTAIEEALYLSKFAREITVIHRRDRLRATKILQERIFSNQVINFSWNSIPLRIEGTNKVEGIFLKDTKTKQGKEIKCDGVFIFVGYLPETNFLKNIIQLEDKGYIHTDDNMMSSVEGIYACGDVRNKLLRQVVTACGEGATAAFAAQRYVEDLKGVSYN
jgi:thioredoxin reductase (NADPH)